MKGLTLPGRINTAFTVILLVGLIVAILPSAVEVVVNGVLKVFNQEPIQTYPDFVPTVALVVFALEFLFCLYILMKTYLHNKSKDAAD